jgi:magnesium transporter
MPVRRGEGGSHMLINSVAYQQGNRLQDVALERIPEFLARGDCFVWVALKDPQPEELDRMQEYFELPDLAVEDARHGHQRPKLEEYGDSLFLALHLPEFWEGELMVGELNVFVGSNYVVSVRSRSSQSFLGVRARCEREPELLRYGPGFVLYALMDAAVDGYFPILDRLETELERIEEKIFSKGSMRHNIERLYDLKQSVMVLKHAVAPLMEAGTRLFGGRVPRLCAQTGEYFRDVHDHLTRLDAAIDTMRDTGATAIHVNLAMVALEESEVTKKLAAWAGIFAAATAFAGVWGMNFEYMPELKWRLGYPFALVMITIVCGLLYRRFRKAGWL